MPYRYLILFIFCCLPREASFGHLDWENKKPTFLVEKREATALKIKEKHIIVDPDGIDDTNDGYLGSEVLDIQFNADKAHGVYVSRHDTIKKLRIVERETYPYIGEDGQMGLLEHLLFSGDDDDEEAKAVSTAVAKYRFATDEEEKEDIINSLIDIMIIKAGSERSDELLNCDSGTYSYGGPQDSEVVISFRSRINSIERFELQSWDGRTQINNDLSQYFSGLKKMNQVRRIGHISGVLYAWVNEFTSEEMVTKFQSCVLELPL